MADGVAVEARGKPVVTVVGSAFLRGAEMRRRALGLPSLALQVFRVPYSEAAAREQAAKIADSVAALLLEPADRGGS